MKISSHRFRECLTTRASDWFFFFFKKSKWETTNTGSPHYDPAFLRQHPVTKTWSMTVSNWEEWKNLAHSVYQHPLYSIEEESGGQSTKWFGGMGSDRHSESLESVLSKGEILPLCGQKKTKQMKTKLGIFWLESTRLKLWTQITRSCNLSLSLSRAYIMCVQGENYLMWNFPSHQ